MPSLGNDLASKRKELNLSIEDVYQSTKIPLAILKSIEDDSIFTTLDENQTYIRSYIRTYAKALHIDDNQIIRALNQIEAGSYLGFAGSPREDEPVSRPQDEASALEEPEDQDSKKDMVHDHVPGPASADDSDLQSQNRSIHASPDVKTVDWADLGRRFTPLQTKSRMWVGLTLLILAVAATALFIGYQNYQQGDSTDPVSELNSPTSGTEIPAVDSLQLNFTTPTEHSEEQAGISETTLETLPDTLSLIVYAAYGVLEPVRVYTDVMDGLNPYWIEQGQAYQFKFVNTIRIRGQYSRMVLLFNGHVVRNFRQQYYNPESRMLEFDRSVFENDPAWLQPAPDSLALDAPPPTTIIERPTFY